MRYSIITPTLLRDTLPRLCQSIESQSCADWEHILVVDTLDVDRDLIASIEHPQRLIVYCERAHHDWASTCRRNAWDVTSGEYLLYIDDDNYFSDTEVLETLRFATKPVVLFPLFYRGEMSSPDPIKVGRSDTNQLMVNRDIGRWPELPLREVREADGIFIVQLTNDNPYEVFRDRALVVYECENNGSAK